MRAIEPLDLDAPAAPGDVRRAVQGEPDEGVRDAVQELGDEFDSGLLGRSLGVARQGATRRRHGLGESLQPLAVDAGDDRLPDGLPGIAGLTNAGHEALSCNE